MSQIAIERPGIPRELGTVQQDAAWAPQPPDRPTPGVDEAVIGPAPCLIQLLVSRQWQAAPGLWIDILRIHGFLSIAVGLPRHQ